MMIMIMKMQHVEEILIKICFQMLSSTWSILPTYYCDTSLLSVDMIQI